jgi:SWIM zinc finger
MDSGMIGKIEKAKRYAEERNRVRFDKFTVTFDGDNNPHTVVFEDATWRCNCEFFLTHSTCSHTMALERILEGMIPETVS